MKHYIIQTHPNRGRITIENVHYEFYTNSQVLPGVSSNQKQVFTTQFLKDKLFPKIEFECIGELILAIKNKFHKL